MFNPTIAWITVRALLGRRRAILLAVPGAILLLLTILLRTTQSGSTSWPGEVLGRVGFSALLPLTALIIGTSVLGAEIDDNSILHLLATPVPRSAIVFTKAVVSVGVTLLFAALPEFVAGVIASGSVSRLALGLGLGSVLGSVVYTGVFLAISATTRRPVPFALGYVAIWEVLIANLVTGAKYLSVQQYSLGVANSIARDSSLGAHLNALTAVILAAIVTAATLYAAASRLRSFRLSGDS